MSDLINVVTVIRQAHRKVHVFGNHFPTAIPTSWRSGLRIHRLGGAHRRIPDNIPTRT